MATEPLDPGVTPPQDPTNRVVAVFDSPEAAEQAARALEGLEHVQDVDLICGVRVAEPVNPDAHDRAMLGKVVDRAHRSNDSVEMGYLDEQLRAGHCVVSFRSDLVHDLVPAVHLLEGYGGRYINHFGAAFVTLLRP